jgi:hypothetical protein
MEAHATVKLTSDESIKPGPTARLLPARMPLHAITAVYGEAGLRERGRG